MLELVKYRRFFSFTSYLQCFKILSEHLQPAGIRVPDGNLGVYTLFNVDLETSKCPSARWPSAPYTICRDSSVFNRKSILLHYLLSIILILGTINFHILIFIMPTYFSIYYICGLKRS